VKGQGLKNLYRIRVGEYRLLYQVLAGELLILVVHIGHRKDVYRKR
jgi:mRNA interferase RelE/StbE